MKLLNKELTDAQRINHVLQAAIDHYPRLAAFKFSLQGANTDALFLPDKTTQHILNHPARSDTGAPASVLSFHAAVGHRLGNHVLTRIAAGKTSPPTLLRWVWETGGDLPRRMLLMFNLATCHHPRQGTGSAEEGLKAAASLLSEAWNHLCPAGELT